MGKLHCLYQSTTGQYRFRKSLLGKQILQVAIMYRDWDTKAWEYVGPEYLKWRDAKKHNAERVLRKLANK